MMSEYSEKDYPFLVNDIIKYIEKIKRNNKDISMIEIIMDYCFKYNVEVEVAGDAISSDNYFKSYIEKDCELHRFFKSKINFEEW